MPAFPASPTPLVSPAEMQILVSRAGLMLNPGQMADLVLVWRQVARLLALIPRDRPLADDQACVFKLAVPSAAAAQPAARPRPAPAKKSAKSKLSRPAKKPIARKAAPRTR